MSITNAPVDGNVVASSRSRRGSRVSRLLTGAILLVLLAGGVAFVSVKSARDHATMPPRPAQLAPTAQASPTSIGVAIPGCYNPTSPPADRPVKLNIVGCASTAVALQDMSWSSWAPASADGTGSAVFKVCQPNCANGYQVTSPVVVHAWNPQPPRANSDCPAGLKFFADMTLAFPKGAPPAAAQETNTLYNGSPAVHYTNYQAANPRDGQFIGYTFCD